MKDNQYKSFLKKAIKHTATGTALLFATTALHAQTVRVLDIQPSTSRTGSADQIITYNLSGFQMRNAKAKLACTNLFGTSGIVTHPIAITTAAGTLGSIDAALLANYDVVFMAAMANSAATNYYTAAEIDALKVWSTDPKHVIISAEQQHNQFFTNSMGLTILNGNTDPTTVDASGIDSTTTKLFSGVFGTPTAAGITQGGAAQGYFTSPCGASSLAKNAANNSTIVINNYNDLFLADGDFFSNIGTSVSGGCTVTSNTDMVWLNLWAWAVDQVINGSSSPRYISSAAPPIATTSTAMPSTATNTGQVQTTVPSGYTLTGWQTSTNSGSTWTSLGSTANPYTYTNAANGQMYQAILSAGGSCPNAYSNIITITYCTAAGTTAPSLSGNALNNTCPVATVNLNSLHTATAPGTSQLVWFTNNTHTGTAYATPTAATAGTYYAFYYDSTNNCYSPVSNAVTVTIMTCCAAGATGPDIN